MGIQSAQAQCRGGFFDHENNGRGQSCHDINGDIHSNGRA